ncbi:undecaprenyldiphospho-muramoylpentapeptide beta-N-acetylglucosaminyltransferase [Lactobacillus sp. DCY120]|uniref:UDP-N-acetylglucosamine--N-acetylmuramyl-(pentapeptide) pyrophosphoryl-undecaprenol N-acetylglucosamine transferase n=1 Tax=Bombilactobacillus apium TaxID=2675299 RepID=A0A850R8E6_9LACO|nr:undecaprenyldiphospho-muramoylpentapeptide beta-N-acetylglucosaminyltransferase [Bombilactobacillus apium]NVY95676.1 undecaprenyldiphospho-muramoylpentapeptide beta-N-acetylglucosaminyltransferase [Bombilactobacillus apium]
MRIIVSGGGTGGHIYPALALIKRLQERNLVEEVLYVGTAEGLEQRIVAREGIKFQAIKVQGFKRRLTWDNVKTIRLFLQSVYTAKKIVQEFKPDVVVGTGGYVCGAMVFAAHLKKVPTVIHEQNSVAGVTNKFLGRFVDKIAYVFPEVKAQFKEQKKLVFTGNPRAQEVADLQPNQRLQDFNLEAGKPTVLIFGGSRGAAPINQTVQAILPRFQKCPYQVLFVTGQVHYQEIEQQLAAITIPENVQVIPYLEDMPTILPDITLIVGRSGATSIAELTALGIPAIFIPSPYVTHNHQMKNAESLVQEKAALLITEAELTPTKLFNLIDQTVRDQSLLTQLQSNSRQMGVVDASDRLIKVLTELISKVK